MPPSEPDEAKWEAFEPQWEPEDPEPVGFRLRGWESYTMMFFTLLLLVAWIADAIAR